MQQILSILKSDIDVNSCLLNCSNQGVCTLKNQTYVCECNANFIGKSCQIDTRPCSQSNKCLNNGTCINSLDLTSYSCKCVENGLYYGEYCENMRNLCENVTCSFHGYCTQSQSDTKCKCYNGYEGKDCETEIKVLKIVKNVQWLATAICIIVILIFWSLVIGSDVLDFLKIADEHIDMDEWRHEKFGLN
jgi:hypothetical protein